MRSVKKLGIEKRAESYGRRRHHHVDRDPAFYRFAGEIFGVELRDKARRQERETKQKLQSTRGVGLGFGEKDQFGPDDSWDTKDPIRYTPSQGY
jgi:hypothetical protein